jgi:hypothetical protein
MVFDSLRFLHKSSILNLWALGIGLKHEHTKANTVEFSSKSPNFRPKLVMGCTRFLKSGLVTPGKEQVIHSNNFDAIDSSTNPVETSILEVGLAF